MPVKFPAHVESINELKNLFQIYEIDEKKVRFFINPEDVEPKMFAIVNNDDNYIVYKVKADGKLVERYNGKDEYKAVNIFYDRFLEEVRNRKEFVKYLPDSYDDNVHLREGNSENTKKKKTRKKLILAIIIIFVITIFLIARFSNDDSIAEGYYTKDNNTYYRYHNNWYYYDNDYYSWVYYDQLIDDYLDYDYIYSYEDDNTYQDFKDSDYYDYSANSSDDDFGGDWDFSNDSWDFSDTNWDSDW